VAQQSNARPPRYQKSGAPEKTRRGETGRSLRDQKVPFTPMVICAPNFSRRYRLL
jgi:hypothetical protein